MATMVRFAHRPPRTEILGDDADVTLIDEAAGFVVALGADLHPTATPGLLEVGHEFYTLAHDFLQKRGLREKSEIHLVMPLGAPIPPSPAASAVLREP